MRCIVKDNLYILCLTYYSPEYRGSVGEDIELVSHRCEMLRHKSSLEDYTNLVISFMNNKDCFEMDYDIKLGNIRFEPVV